MPLEREKKEEESSLKKTSEKEEKIRKEAKSILDKFASALSKIEKVPDSYVEREEDRREEKDGERGDEEFRKIFFENAPAVKKDCIEAERGRWK